MIFPTRVAAGGRTRPAARLLAPLALCAGLAACGPDLTAEQCVALDWYGQGLAAGERGADAGAYARLADHCAEFGVRADARAWEEGRRDGLARWCTPRTAFVQASRGRDVTATCAGYGDDRRGMARAREDGFEVRRLDGRIFDLDQERRRTERDLRALPREHKFDRARDALLRALRRLDHEAYELRRDRDRIAARW